MSKFSKDIKLPRDLNVDDPFFTIESESVDEHKEQRGNAYSGRRNNISQIRYFTKKEHTVEMVQNDSKDKSFIIVNGAYTAPKMGYNGIYPENAIYSDSKLVEDAIVTLNIASYDEAITILGEIKKQMEDAEKRVNFLKKTISLYDPNLDTLRNRTSKQVFVGTVIHHPGEDLEDNEKEEVVVQIERND
jgi:N-methylhydantoinase A/oxoprolinase/acetone carboxylase beta subunit